MGVKTTAKSIFIQGLILTLSNPLTIVFWGSVLTGKIIEDNLTGYELTVFSTGLVSATLFFMTGAACFGTVLKSFIVAELSAVLNMSVGVVIILFGIKMLIRKPAD